MAYLFSLIFQGELTSEADVSSAQQHDVERHAFPSSPPRDAAVADDYRAFKVAPLEGRRLLVSVAAGGGRDPFDRPVLQATGCVLEADELLGPLRDVGALWEVLEQCDVGAGFEAFKERVSGASFCASPEAFQRFRAALERYGGFYGRLAAALGDSRGVDLYLGPGNADPDLVRPAFGLLPMRHLRRLHLVLGGETSEYREPVVGLTEDAPADLGTSADGPVRQVLSWYQNRRQPVAVDCRRHEVVGTRSSGPGGLAEAITDPRPWPDGTTGLGRYQVLLQCLDAAPSEDASLTPFDLRPELDELRRAVRRLEGLSRDLEGWR